MSVHSICLFIYVCYVLCVYMFTFVHITCALILLIPPSYIQDNNLLILLHIHRFTAEEKAKHHPCAYLPFGLGPRNCVGMRLALMEAKMALIEIVRNFKIELSPETKVLIIRVCTMSYGLCVHISTDMYTQSICTLTQKLCERQDGLGMGTRSKVQVG